MAKKFPKFKTDDEMAHFLETADLSEYDFSDFKPFHFEFRRKSAQLNMRLPAELLAQVKAHARKRGMPYTRFIRESLEQSLARSPQPRPARKSAGRSKRA